MEKVPLSSIWAKGLLLFMLKVCLQSWIEGHLFSYQSFFDEIFSAFYFYPQAPNNKNFEIFCI